MRHRRPAPARRRRRLTGGAKPQARAAHVERDGEVHAGGAPARSAGQAHGQGEGQRRTGSGLRRSGPDQANPAAWPLAPPPGSIGNAEPCASILNATSVIWPVMDPRVHADEFMLQLLAAHGAEDAFVPQPEDDDEEPAARARIVSHR